MRLRLSCYSSLLILNLKVTEDAATEMKTSNIVLT